MQMFHPYPPSLDVSPGIDVQQLSVRSKNGLRARNGAKRLRELKMQDSGQYQKDLPTTPTVRCEIKGAYRAAHKNPAQLERGSGGTGRMFRQSYGDILRLAAHPDQDATNRDQAIRNGLADTSARGLATGAAQ